VARSFLSRLVPLSPAIPYVERRALVHALDTAANRRVCVVLAGPGWGKTTTLAAWLGQVCPVGAALGPTSDDEMRRFLVGLRDALRGSSAVPWELLGSGTGQPGGPAGLGDPAYPGDPAGPRDRDRPDDDVVLVLDDLADLLAPAGLWGLVEELCHYAVPWLHMVVLSRRELPFSLRRLRGQGLVAEVDAPRLAFDVDEVAMLLEATTGTADRELAGAIRTATGGWPAAVRMAVDTCASALPEDRDGVLRHIARPGGRLGEYLAEEVLAAEPPGVGEMLRRIAVVRQVTPALCDVLGFGDEARALSDLARRGLVELGPGQEPSWSLAPVVRDFLLAGRSLPAEERTALHQAAATFHTGRRSYPAALTHLSAAGDHPAIASLLADHGSALVEAGEADTVLAVAELPAAASDDRRVQQALGYARHVRGQWARALEAFRRAGADEEKLPPGLSWRMGLIQHTRGEVDLALALYRRGALAGEDTPDEALLLSWLAAAQHLTGDYAACTATVTRAVAAASRCRHSGVWAAVDTVRAMLAASEGDRAGADAYFSSATQWADASGDLLQRARITAYRADYLAEMGDLADARRQVDSALQRNERCRYAALHAHMLKVRGMVRALRGELDAALRDLTTAGEIFQNGGSRFLGRALVGVGYVHRVRGELAQARAAYEDALAQAEPSRDVRSLAQALSGLARVRAVDAPETARALAERAVEVAPHPSLVRALHARGWVALLAGEHRAAAEDATRAAAVARGQRDRAALAEALELSALAGRGRHEAVPMLAEAVQIWAEVGYPVEEAQARLVAARLAGERVAAGLAEQVLREHGVRLDGQHAAGPLAVLARSAPSISIRTLGVFRVVREGQPVPAGAWRSKKARMLLKILVARRGRPVSREQLTELLWPREDQGTASRRLSVLLSTVRGVLGAAHQPADEGPVVADRDVIWLDLGHVDVDVERFLALAAVALEADGRGLPGATERLAAVEAGYAGDFLEDDPYEEWASSLREEARAAYTAVLKALVRRVRAAADVDSGLRYALRLLECDRYDESAHLDLVHMLLTGGRRGEAWRRYREYVWRMTEIGVRPAHFPQASPAIRIAAGAAE